MDIRVGDRVTYKNLEGKNVTTLIGSSVDIGSMKEILETRELLKIERPTYEVIEEKKELLTEEEKEFLKSYIKIIENLNNGEVTTVKRSDVQIILHLRTALDYYAEVGPRFSNMVPGKAYTLKELGLE